jgi:hypothetical protein
MLAAGALIGSEPARLTALGTDFLAVTDKEEYSQQPKDREQNKNQEEYDQDCIHRNVPHPIASLRLQRLADIEPADPPESAPLHRATE